MVLWLRNAGGVALQTGFYNQESRDYGSHEYVIIDTNNNLLFISFLLAALVLGPLFAFTNGNLILSSS